MRSLRKRSNDWNGAKGTRLAQKTGLTTSASVIIYEGLACPRISPRPRNNEPVPRVASDSADITVPIRFQETLPRPAFARHARGQDTARSKSFSAITSSHRRFSRRSVLKSFHRRNLGLIKQFGYLRTIDTNPGLSADRHIDACISAQKCGLSTDERCNPINLGDIKFPSLCSGKQAINPPNLLDLRCIVRLQRKHAGHLQPHTLKATSKTARAPR